MAVSRMKSHGKRCSVSVENVLKCSSEEQDIAQSYDLGANSFIRKPVDFTQFAQYRTSGLDWLVLNEPAPPKGR